MPVFYLVVKLMFEVCVRCYGANKRDEDADITVVTSKGTMRPHERYNVTLTEKLNLTGQMTCKYMLAKITEMSLR